MSLSLALALTLTVGAGPSTPPEPPAAAGSGEPFAGLRSYLRRPVPRSARYLDHGTLVLKTAVGAPHLYRLDLQVGLFDHLGVGLTTHWLPGQRLPQVWPVGSVAFLRYRSPRTGVGAEFGAHYRPVLFPPPEPEAFTPQTHLALASFVVSAGFLSAGLDFGVAHTRIPVVDPEDIGRFRRRAVFGGGAGVRAGNRRIGLSADALVALGPKPLLVFELALDLRFGAFEERPRGGWLEP